MSKYMIKKPKYLLKSYTSVSSKPSTTQLQRLGQH